MEAPHNEGYGRTHITKDGSRNEIEWYSKTAAMPGCATRWHNFFRTKQKSGKTNPTAMITDGKVKVRSQKQMRAVP